MDRRSPHRGSAAVAPVVVALALAAAGCGGDADDTPAADAAGSPAPVAPSEADGQVDATTDPPPLTGGDVSLTPGTYRFSFVTPPGGAAPEALVDVVPGFLGGDSWYVVSSDREEFLGLWVVGLVDRDACRHQDADAVDPGPSVADLVDALAAQRSTRATTPEPVRLAGHRGLYVELTGPRHLDRCARFPGLWRAPERGLYVDGQVDRVWILDVDGRRLVVDAAYGPGTGADEREGLTTMVESLELVGAG